MEKRALTFALLTFLAVRILITLLLLVASLAVEPNRPPAPFEPAVVSDLQARGPLARLLVLPWYRWDTVHYIEIATQGYAANLQNTVWPPLYPALIALLSLVIQPPMLAGLVVANLAAIGALYFVYLLVADVWGETRARRVVLWTVLFPTGFFLLAGYTESLFLLFGAAALYYARRQRWWLSGGMAMLAALTRLPGAFLAAPILWEAWRAYRAGSPGARCRECLLKAGAAAALAPLAVGIFALWVHFGLAADWPWATLERYWHLRFAMPWEGIIGTLNMMAREPVGLEAMSKFFDVLLGIWAVVLLLIGLRRLPFQYTLYVLVLLVPSMTKILNNDTLMSISRYVLPIFPLFVLHDRLITTRGARIAVGISFLVGQALLAFMFYRWMWVA